MLQELPEGWSKQKQSDFNFMVLFKCVLSRWQQHLHSTHPADHNIQTYTSLARYYMHVKLLYNTKCLIIILIHLRLKLNSYGNYEFDEFRQ